MNRKIKILFVIDQYVNSSAGTEGQIYELIKALDKDIFEIEACVFRYETDYFERNNFPCPVSCFDIRSFSSLSAYFGFYRLRKYIRGKKFDIVQTIFNDSALSIPLTALGLNVRVVSTRRDMGFWYTPIKLMLLRFNKFFTDRYLVNSAAVRENVHRKEKVPVEKISVIYNGHDFSRFKMQQQTDLLKDLSIPEGSSIVGIVANMRPVKRVNDLIAAFSKVVEIDPEPYLIVVGHPGKLDGEYRALIKTYGIENRVRFLGMVKEPVPIIKHFAVGVNCSETEGLSNSIIEYMSCGVPVVATDTSGNRELIENGVNGVLVPVGDIEQLKSAIVRILKNKQTGWDMAVKSKKLAKSRFALDAIIAEYTKFYTELSEEFRLQTLGAKSYGQDNH